MCDTDQPQLLEVGACFATTKLLRSAVGERLAQDGRSFVASGTGGQRQKGYKCGGYTGGCPVNVRAYRKNGGEPWKVHTVVLVHIGGCTGGNTRGRSAAFGPTAKRALNDNPNLLGTELLKKIERDSGVKVTGRTASRMTNMAKSASQAAVAESYQHLASYAAQLQKECPGSVAEVEVRRRLLFLCCVGLQHCVDLAYRL